MTSHARHTSHTGNARQARTPTVITVAQALAQGVSPRSLRDVANWNDNQRGPLTVRQRRASQATELRRVAAQLAASNDNRAAERKVA